MTQPRPPRQPAPVSTATVTGQQRQYIAAAYNQGRSRADARRILADAGMALPQRVVSAVYDEVVGIRQGGALLNRTGAALIPSLAAFPTTSSRLEGRFRVSGSVSFRDAEGNLTDTFYAFHTFNTMPTISVLRGILLSQLYANSQQSPPLGTSAEFQFLSGEQSSEE